jgi:hypothetical protein
VAKRALAALIEASRALSAETALLLLLLLLLLL